MVMSFFRGAADGGLEHVEHQVVGMLNDCRHTFDVAMAALVGGADPEAVNEDIRATDRRVNRTEREVRRELVIHATVHGGQEVGTILTYLLLVKKIERVGDQNKNILDLAFEGVTFEAGEERDRLIEYRDEISALFSTTAEIFTEPDEERAAEVFERGQALLHEFNDLVVEEVHRHEGDAGHAVARALLFRYMKRVAANLVSVTESVMRPIAEMDYDEQGEDTDE